MNFFTASVSKATTSQIFESSLEANPVYQSRFLFKYLSTSYCLKYFCRCNPLTRAQEGPVRLLPDPKRRLMSLLLEEPQSAVSLAEKLNIFESAVRQHLQTLENSGLVTSKFEQRGLGRPKKIFFISQSGAELFDRKYDTLLDMMLTKIVETYGPQALRSIVLSIAKDLGTTLDRSGENASYRERLKTVTDALDEFGFATKLEEKDGKISIISKNCIILRTARANHDLMCHKFHVELIRAALKPGKVELHECMVDGASFCRHVISKSERDD